MCREPLETVNHIFFECAFSRRFWDTVGFAYPADADVRLLHTYGAPPGVPAGTETTFQLLCLWNLWKHRNATAFRVQCLCLPLLLSACRDDAHLWRIRLPGDQDLAVAAWLQCLAAPR
jgi:hypothetical protein